MGCSGSPRQPAQPLALRQTVHKTTPWLPAQRPPTHRHTGGAGQRLQTPADSGLCRPLTSEWTTNVQLCWTFFSWAWCTKGWSQVTDTPSMVSANCTGKPGHRQGGPRPCRPDPLTRPHSPPGPHCCCPGTQPAAAPGTTPAPPARPPALEALPSAPAVSTPAAPALNEPWCRRPHTHRGRAWGRDVSRPLGETPHPREACVGEQE